MHLWTVFSAAACFLDLLGGAVKASLCSSAISNASPGKQSKVVGKDYIGMARKTAGDG